MRESGSSGARAASDGGERPTDERDAGAAAPQGEPAAPAKKRGKARLIAVLVMLVVCAGIGFWYFSHRGLESTDDAQVEAEIVSVPARTGGVVLAVHVGDNQPVKEGDLLVELDDAPAKARLAQAEAELAQFTAELGSANAEVTVVSANATGSKSVAEASVAGASAGLVTSADDIAQAKAAVQSATVARDQAKSDLDRIKKLFDGGAVTQTQLDHAQSTFDAAEANVEAARARQQSASASTAAAVAKINEAKARLGQTSAIGAMIEQAKARAAAAQAKVDTARAIRDLAKLDVGYTKIVSPHAGIVSRKSASVGQMLQPGQPVMMIVPLDEVWVTANFKETQLQKMHVGQRVELDVDAYPGLKLEGEIESMSAATGARFSLLPPDNATGNFTKVVQRVPVRIKLKNVPPDRPLRPGMSCDATVDTRK